MLIDFTDGAQRLAEVGARLKENREKRAEHLEELRRLDREYEEISRSAGVDPEFYQLLARINGLRGPG